MLLADFNSNSVFQSQDICRDGHPVPGRMCAASRMVARDQMEKVAARLVGWLDFRWLGSALGKVAAHHAWLVNHEEPISHEP